MRIRIAAVGADVVAEVVAPDEVVELLLHDGVDEWACELWMWRSVWLRLLGAAG